MRSNIAYSQIPCVLLLYNTSVHVKCCNMGVENKTEKIQIQEVCFTNFKNVPSNEVINKYSSSYKSICFCESAVHIENSFTIVS